ncbi:ABC transporter permease [Homoserinibacter sp. GY 40078]|uniref:ABC transporter permease n=1 Tax=Homoserinibacter sp. GY 40078 TaxID=2603275 RepID=UPI002104146F|nr:ABC transporter permease [Homoserinibacter sp. GY 40078]
MTATAPNPVDELDRRRRFRMRRVRLPRAWRRPLAVIGLVVVAFWVLVVIFGPLIAPYDPIAQDSARYLPPSAEHLFGTDGVGRDVFSRVVSGARISLPVAVGLVALSLAIGSTVGAIAGYAGGVVDGVLMRIVDLFFSFPAIVLAMAVSAALGPSLLNAVAAIVVVSWPAYARVTRSLVLGLRDANYIQASRLLGASAGRALLRDIAPNVIGPILVVATLELGNAILLLSGLSFLGLGAVPPTPEWGAMVADGARAFYNYWVALFPGLAIFSVVLAFNFIGDALRDALDPRTERAVGNVEV